MKRPFGAVFTFQYLLASKLEINSFMKNFSRIVEEVFRCPSWYDIYPEPFNVVLINLIVPSNGPWTRSWSPGNVSSGFSKLFTVYIYVSALYTSQFFTDFLQIRYKHSCLKYLG